MRTVYHLTAGSRAYGRVGGVAVHAASVKGDAVRR